MKKSAIWDSIGQSTDRHRTLPFWSWNDRLEPEELREQIRQMHDAGFGGFFMHARAGLTTPYMQEEWMEAIRVSMEEAKRYGMESWAYDENGWPSGFANGGVPSLGENYQQKGLAYAVIEEGKPLPERTLGVYRQTGGRCVPADEPKSGDIAVYVVVNRYYIDALNPDSIAEFLKQVHEAYQGELPEQFGRELIGFFTDEPQYANGLVPWSPTLEKVLTDEGENVREHLGALFTDTVEDRAFRYRYYHTAAVLYEQNFIRQMYDWCHDHGVMLTGHVMMEDSLEGQLCCTGGAMPCYEYFDMPGIDWLGRGIASPVIPKQLGSVAAQLGKTRTLSESFALCGWDVRFNELRWIAQWQFLNGVNTLCQHLSAYSLRGLRKRDYPASLYIQEPWFAEYRSLQDYFARTGAALEQGVDDTKVLLLHPLGNAAGYYNKADATAARELSFSFDRITTELSGMHLLHHYGDETVMSHYGAVDGELLKVGNCRYEAVVIPPCDSVSASTAALLTEYMKSGGRVVAIEKVPTLVEFRKNAEFAAVMAHVPTVADAVRCVEMLSDLRHARVLCDGKEESRVHMAVRRLSDGQSFYYLASLSPEALGKRTLKLPGRVFLHELNLQTEEEYPISGCFDGEDTVFSLSFDEAESHLLLTVGEPESVCVPKPVETLTFDAQWDVTSVTDNALTLDCCRYRIDDGQWQEETAVITLQKKLLELRRPCRYELEFAFDIDAVADIGDVSLVMEDPHKYTVSMNGCGVDFSGENWFVDKSFSRSAPLSHLKSGRNIVSISGEFYQHPHVYELLFGENVHESELNKLNFDTELESLYLVGDFGVRSDTEPQEVQRHALWCGHEFMLCAPTKNVPLANITTEGYYFFAGRMRLEQTVSVNLLPDTQYEIAAEHLRVAAARIFVNGKDAGLLSLAPYRLDVTPYLHNGDNRVEIELFTGCRNLLGPHHRACGESYLVAPATFTAEKDWSDDPAPYWRNDYCFVTTGVLLPEKK